MKRIVLTGGGTAGHVMPNLALLPYLGDIEVHYIGSVGGMEKSLTAGMGVIYHEIPCVKLVRGAAHKNILLPFRLIRAVEEAKRVLCDIEPDVIFSKGGYVGLPVCLAAKRTPLVLHESDIKTGLANRLSMRKRARLLTAFDCGKGEHVGAPLRREIYSGERGRALSECGLDDDKPFLLVTGGSLGARAVGEAVVKNLAVLTKKFNVVHLTGRGGRTDTVARGYYQKEFALNMADYLALADICLTRGGANTLFELASLSKPSLIVPLPLGVSRGDQIDNARYFRERGYAHVLEQERLDELPRAIERLYRERGEIQARLRNATNLDGTKKIAEIIKSYLD